MNLRRAVLSLTGCVIVLILFAIALPWWATSYAHLQVLLICPLVSPNFRFAVDDEGIVVYHVSNEKLLVRRDFTSFGGLGLTLALWLFTPALNWRRRLSFAMFGLTILLIFHMFVLGGLIAFAQATEGGRAGGLYTLLYSFLVVSDWVVSILFWGFFNLRYLV